MVGVLAAVAFAGCEGGCHDPEIVDAEEAGADELGDQVSGVLRLARFNERHFDLQHWWAESVEAGRLVNREDRPGGIAAQPAREFHRWVTEVVGEEQAQGVDWQDAVEVVLWEDDGDEWRWAVGMTLEEEGVDWSALGSDHRHWQNPVVDEVISVYRGDAYYGAEARISHPGESGSDRRMVISNFEAGAAHFGEAVAATGEGSGVEAVEFYGWPSRLGFADRYADMADEMGSQLVAHGLDIPPGQLEPHLLRIRFADRLADADFWPEVVRLWMSFDRDEETQGAEEIRLHMDLARDDETIVDLLAHSLKSEDYSDVRWFQDVHGQMHIQAQSDVWPAVVGFFDEALGLERLSEVRDPDDGQFFERLGRLMESNAGPTSLVALPTRVPPPHTGEFMMRWELIDEGVDRDNLYAMHEALMEETWLPLFRRDEYFVRHPDDELFEELEGTWGSVVFAIGHGHGMAGACWVDDEGWLSILYGARPCERLAELLTHSHEAAPSSALSYTGTLSTTLERLLLPVDHELEDVFDEDLVVQVDVDDVGEDHLRLTTATRETIVAAHLVDRAPRLRGYWDMTGWSRLEGAITEPGASPPRVQAPGLQMVGVPGLVGSAPTSMLLGMPFSYMPMDVDIFQSYYFHGGLRGHLH